MSHSRSEADFLSERVPGRNGVNNGNTYFHPSCCSQLRSRAISVPGTTLGLKAITPTSGNARARWRTYIRIRSLDANIGPRHDQPATQSGFARARHLQVLGDLA